MESNKLETISNLFEGKEIRSVWDSEKEEYYFSVIGALTDLGEIATRELAKEHKPYGLKENRKVAKKREFSSPFLVLLEHQLVKNNINE